MTIEQLNEAPDSQKVLEKVLLEFRIRLNRKLYEEESISFDVYQNMENYLIKKLNSLNKNY